MNIHIFISYGHDGFTPQVKTFIESLKKRKEDYVIWWDERLEPSTDYNRQIEDELFKLKNNKPYSCLIYIITPYSVDETRYNYCINEISKALNDKVRVLPIKISKAHSPIQIGCLQWLDMTQCVIDASNKDFQKRLEDICEKIDSTEPFVFDGKQNLLHRQLNPCQFTLDIERHLTNYCPRQWLLDTTIDWIENRSEPVMLVKGGPGTGKTAFSLWLATRKLPDKIHAWHLCQYNDANTKSLLRCVKSLTYYLASRLPYFYDSFDDWSTLDKLANGNDDDAGYAYKTLILENLKASYTGNDTIVILIDALDEASDGDTNALADMLSQYADDIPQWLKFIITTRNDSSIVVPLSNMSFEVNLDDESNKERCSADIYAYVSANLSSDITNRKEMIDVVTKRSGNVILYAKLLCMAINKGDRIDDINFPKDLNSYYNSHMNRYFGKKCKYNFVNHALPIAQLMLASYQPIKRDFIYQRLRDTEEWCKNKTIFNNVLDQFGPLLKEDEDYILPFHKSLCDWFADPGNKSFSVDRKDGRRWLCEWGQEVLADKFAEEELLYHFYLYQPQYLIAANAKPEELISLFSNIDFWQNRKNTLGIDLMLQRMFMELSLMTEKILKVLFQSQSFRDVLFYFSTDLFNKGLFMQLKKLGFSVVISDDMGDKDKVLAMRYHYINGEYTVIVDNLEILSEGYEDKDLEPLAQNILGLTTKKCGLVSQSADLYRRALDLSASDNTSLERIIYYNLNLSRVLTILCRFEEGRDCLNIALDAFYNKDWRSVIKTTNLEFASRQLELAVRYVNVETELFSLAYDAEVCKMELDWADDLYSEKIRIDRYYPRHLQSKILFLLREHRFDKIEPIMKELRNDNGATYDDVRTDYFCSLYYYAIGQKEKGKQLAYDLLERLRQKNALLIEKTECLALIDKMERQNHLEEVSDELRPWYNHITSIVSQIVPN